MVAQEGLVLKILGDSRVCAEWVGRVGHVLSMLGSGTMNSASCCHASGVEIATPSVDGHGDVACKRRVQAK